MASAAQRRQWFLWQLEPGSTAYHISGALRLRGTLDVEAVRAIFAALVERHESLRTVFRADAHGRVATEIRAGMPIDVTPLDVAGMPEQERAQHVLREVQRICDQPFDLEQGPLLRVGLVREADDNHVLVLVMHHIISDGWSMQIIIDEFAQQYKARVQGRLPELASLSIQYADYAVWQHNCLEAGERERQLDYWLAQLGREQPVLQLPTDHPRRTDGTYTAARHEIVLPAGLVAGLRDRARAADATVFMVLLAGLQALLHRYTGERDIRVGVPIANRHRVETEALVGFFVNTQVLRGVVGPHQRLDVLLAETRTAALGAQEHQDLPFEQLVEAVQPERHLGTNPLFQVMFNHQRQEAGPLAQLPGLTLEEYALGGQAAQFELMVETMEDTAGHMTVTFRYAAELFSDRTITRMATHYTALLRALAEKPQQTLGEVALLDADELRQLRRWGVDERSYPDMTPVHQLFERQASRQPGAQALLFGDQLLTYGELNVRANRLAHRLIALGVAPEVKVGIAVERSMGMVVGLLAILKAGGAYVPIDPDYPADRMAYMMEDSGIGLLLTDREVGPKQPMVAGVKVLEIESLDLGAEPSHDPQVALHGENLAYVIYTSGSTGRPKGAANRHGALHNRLAWMQEAYQLDGADTVLQKTPFGFDVSVWEFFWPLMTGARLALARPGDHRDPARLVDAIQSFNVTTLHFVPSMLQAFLAHEGIEVCRSVRRIVCSGEALPAEAQNGVFARLPGAVLYNLYGPTEAAIDVTHWTCRDDGRSQVPIGRPIAGIGTYVLDEELNLTPAGVSGELYLGGAGLARGYLNRPALSAERFVANPFGGHGELLYRTGDLVKWNAMGSLDYLGRIDHQVKIRGLRIELGEVEAQLLSQPEVREAVVVAAEGPGGARLVAYVSAAAGAVIEMAALRERLGRQLPEYMVPATIMVLEGLPLNANGKVDRKALPAPEAAAVAAYEPPQGEVEEALAATWAEVLGVERVGRSDNFFELGGDSILSLQIVAGVRRAGWRLAPRHIFERQTIIQLAPAVIKDDSPVDAPVSQLEGGLPLLPIQAEFFDTPVQARHHWNQSVLLECREPLDLEAMKTALAALVDHHNSLRLRYHRNDTGAWDQAYDTVPDSQLQELLWVRQAGSERDIPALCDVAQRSLDLSRGPLIRALVIELTDGGSRLLLAIHHLVVDGVSWRILLEDLQLAYAQGRAGKEIVLPAKTSSYKDWASLLQSKAGTFDQQTAYWQATADGQPELPCDDRHGANRVDQQAEVTLRLDRDLTDALLRQAPAASRTRVSDILLTALGRALCQWSGRDRVLIDLEGHGREDLSADIDLSRSVGWFTSLFPVLLEPMGGPGAALRRVKEGLRTVPDGGIGFGALKYLGTTEQQRLLRALPRPQVIFNYLGQFDGSFDEAAIWRPAEEGGGAALDPAAPRTHELSIEGQVYGGELALTVGYSQARYQRATIEGLAQRFRDELDALIGLCVGGEPAVTPSDFPLARLAQEQIDQLPLPWRDVADLYPLSPMQTGMLFHSLSDPDGSTYVTQMRVDIGGLDAGRFRLAWQAVLARHAVLRTGVLSHDDQALQWVARQAELPLRELDWRGREGLEGALAALAKSELEQSFDLATPPLMRIALVRIGDDRHRFIWTVHHLLLDGWSTSRLLGEVLTVYAGGVPDASGAGYRDYIGWLQRRDLPASLAYWQSRLAALEGPTRLAAALPVPSGTADYREYSRVLDARETARLAESARAKHVTLNTLVQGAWALLLQRYTGQRAVCFGATTSGRPMDLPDAERMLGLFINTLPVIVTVPADLGVDDWLRALQAQGTVMREHEYTPLNEIQRLAGSAGASLFDTIVVFENYPVDKALNSVGEARLVFDSLHFSSGNHYPLTLRVSIDGELRLDYLHDTSLVDAAAVERIAGQFAALLNELAKQGARPLGTFELRDVGPVLHGPVPPHAAPDVLTSWSAAVSAQPDAPAVVDEHASLSFGALDAHATALAARLRDAGIAAENRVAIHAGRGCEFVAAVLAVLKAGGIYVPLDPALPPDRLAYVLRDSGAQLVLSATPLACDTALPVVRIDLAQTPAAPADLAVMPAPMPAQGAYLLYTSGSTGQPKGVLVSRGALAGYVVSVLDRMDLPAEARSMAMVSTVAADLGNTVLFGALCSGRLLHLMSTGLVLDPDAFAGYMRRHRVDVLKIVPSHLQALLNAAVPADVLPSSRLVVGGEATRWPLLERVASLKPGCRVLNHYGPTETTVGILTQEAGDASRAAATLPVGRPLAGNLACVLDADLHPVPAGVAGELYLGGANLARGYHGRPAQTAERFIAHPSGAGERLYRTGDRVRMLADGALEFLGRMDGQVKIRGYRVETQEVAQALRAIAGVAEAEVIARTDDEGQMRLHAYVIGRDGVRLDSGDLQARLACTLPEYMVPAAVVPLDAWPLTANGKIDRKVLPDPQARAGERDPGRQVAPLGAAEQTLAAVWCDVLGVAQVGRDDDFFELGGDSIIALKLVARARKRGLQVLPRHLFDGRTLAGVARLIGGSAAEAPQVAIPRLSDDRRTGALPASYAQSRQWIMWQMDMASNAYHIGAALRLSGAIDTVALSAGFDALVTRHESLRTVFRAGDDGQVAQRILEAGAPLEYIDMSGIAASERDERVRAEAARLHATPFDLEHGPLLRVGLIREAADNHVLVVVMHHIISDGWSMRIIIDEFAQQYRARVQGRTPDLAPLAIQYADYAVWQRNWLDAGERQRQLDYWLARLGREQPVLQLPTDYPRRTDGRYGAARHNIALPTGLADSLRGRARAADATVFMVLLAALQALLHRYTGERDIRVGVPIANRHRADTEAVVGFFVNTQVLRGLVEPRQRLDGLLASARIAALGAQEHQDLPFEQLVEALQPERRLGTNPLFQVLFNHQRKDDGGLAHLPGLTLEEYALVGQEAQFELIVDSVEDSAGGIHLCFTYAAELFDVRTIERMAAHYIALLAALADQPQQTLGEVALLDADELRQLRGWGVDERSYPDTTPVHELFERQASRQPDAQALLFGDQVLTYGELNVRANRLAHRLIALGVAPEVKVGIAVERSMGMVVGLLAILKAGGAYVPIDPDYPADRMAYMMEDSGIGLLLTDGEVGPKLPMVAGVKVLEIESLDLGTEPSHDPQVALHGENLAYVIYTSGSTGRPKGAANRHGALHNRLAWMQEAYRLDGADTVLQKTPFGFDVSVWEFFWPLMTGARLALARPGDHRDPARLVDAILTFNVTTLHFVPSMLQAFLAYEGIEVCRSVRRIVCSGEALPAEAQNGVFARLPGAALYNLYGPTEAAIDVTHWTCRDDGRSQVPIGRPIASISTYVLDEELNLTPAGVSGELYLGGAGLARGYLNRPALSAERFVANPLSEKGELLYRTGDLVKWNAMGSLDYLGRIDHQVKIRGLRIELGEVEAQLLAQPEVLEAVAVAADGPGGTRLVAYVSAAAGAVIEIAALRERLGRQLPEYMVPATIMVLESLPLNANGKVDRKALPALEAATVAAYEPPQGKVEEALAAIWAEVLGVERVGRHDNFFELGGHSISILRVHAKARQYSGIRVPLRSMFESPTIAASAVLLSPSPDANGAEDDIERMFAIMEQLEH